MASTIGKVRAVFTASSSGLTAGVNQASASMKRLERDVRGLRGGLSTLTAISGTQLFGSIASGAMSAAKSLLGIGASAFSGLRSAVEEATTLGEETSKSSVIFGQASGEIAKFAANASRIGLSESAALQATGSFGNLFKAMGLGVDTSVEYSKALTSLGADLASFNNATVDESIQAIGAALRGESEPIRRFGVLLDEATLKQKALDAGLIKTTTGSLTPAIKAQAAYAAILEQTAAAQGDFQRTSGSLANLGRIVSAQTTNILGDVGRAFEPVFRSATDAISRTLEAVRPFIQQVAEGVRSAIDVIAAAIQNLIPAFTGFLGGLDGGAIGERIGEGILAGARYLAQVGDWFIANMGPIWEYVSQVGQQWNAVWGVGERVGSFLAGVARLFEAGLRGYAAVLAAVFGKILSGIGVVAAKIPGFGSVGDQLVAAGQSLTESSAQMFADANNALDMAGQNFNDALFGEAEQAGQAMAGPLTTAFDNARNAASEAIGQVDVAAKQTVEIQNPQAVGDAVKQALNGIDSRTTEGMKEYFRILRGDAGGNVQEQQLSALERIADNTEDDAIEMDTYDLAPAAGG